MKRPDIVKEAAKVVADELEAEDVETVVVDGVEHIPVKSGPNEVDGDNEYGWDTDEMETSQTDREVNHEEVDEEYAEVEGRTPEPDNDEGSSGDPSVGTKQVSDAVTDVPDLDGVDIGHLEINEYYRVWIKDPSEAPPEVELHPAEDSQAPPPTEESSHYYEAPFESSVAAVGIEDAAEKLQKYEPDPEFPTKVDIEKSEVSQSDLWAVSAVESDSPEKVTRTALEMAKSPLTLFYVSKRIRNSPDWHGVRRMVNEELDRRGIESVEKIRKAVPVEATEPREFNKRKVYVQEPSDVPDQYEVQEGPNGGTFYEPDGGDDDGIESGEDLEDAARKALEDGDVVDDIPVQAWRDLTGEIEDRDLLVKCLDPIQDHGTKTARDRIRQRLRGMGLEGSEIDDLLADSDAPYTAEEHEEWQETYSEMEIVERQSLWSSDAKTGASAEYMSIEELGDGTTAFSTRYGGAEGNDPDYRSRQMATYQASRALTAEGNVPPHVHAGVDETEGDFDKVAVKEFDGQEAWEAPESYFDEIDRDDYVEQTAKQLLCGNNDLHGDNVMVNEDGDLGFHDLDHSAGRLDQNDPINQGSVIEGSLLHIAETGSYMNVSDSREELIRGVVEEAKEIAEDRGDEVRELYENTDDPWIGEMLGNILHNIEIIEEAEITQANEVGHPEVDL